MQSKILPVLSRWFLLTQDGEHFAVLISNMVTLAKIVIQVFSAEAR